MKRIIFNQHGQAVAFDGEDQVPRLSVPWTILFAEFLENAGENPLDFDLLFFPDEKHGKFIRTSNGDWSWKIGTGPFAFEGGRAEFPSKKEVEHVFDHARCDLDSHRRDDRNADPGLQGVAVLEELRSGEK